MIIQAYYFFLGFGFPGFLGACGFPGLCVVFAI
jgi:hypothetical protein